MDVQLRSERRGTWDHEFVLKRQFFAIIPAFNPGPGRTNVNQTEDIQIPVPGVALFVGAVVVSVVFLSQAEEKKWYAAFAKTTYRQNE